MKNMSTDLSVTEWAELSPGDTWFSKIHIYIKRNACSFVCMWIFEESKLRLSAGCCVLNCTYANMFFDCKYFCSLQFYSRRQRHFIQFKLVSMHSEKPMCFPPLSLRSFPNIAFKMVWNVKQIYG